MDVNPIYIHLYTVSGIIDFNLPTISRGFLIYQFGISLYLHKLVKNKYPWKQFIFHADDI